MMRRLLDNLIQIVALLASHKSMIQLKLWRDDFYQVQFRISGLHLNDRALFDGLYLPQEIDFDKDPFQRELSKLPEWDWLIALKYCVYSTANHN